MLLVGVSWGRFVRAGHVLGRGREQVVLLRSGRLGADHHLSIGVRTAYVSTDWSVQRFVGLPLLRVSEGGVRIGGLASAKAGPHALQEGGNRRREPLLKERRGRLFAAFFCLLPFEGESGLCLEHIDLDCRRRDAVSMFHCRLRSIQDLRATTLCYRMLTLCYDPAVWDGRAYRACCCGPRLQRVKLYHGLQAHRPSDAFHLNFRSFPIEMWGSFVSTFLQEKLVSTDGICCTWGLSCSCKSPFLQQAWLLF